MLKKKRFAKLIVLTILLIALCPFLYWQNNDLVVSRYTYSSVLLPASFDGFTIVQISDLHNACFGEDQKNLLAAISRQEPDIIVITGDLINSDDQDMENAMAFVDGATAIAPVYFISGNHDLFTEDTCALRDQLIDAGVIVLENEITTIQNEGGDSFNLIGLSDANLADDTLSNLCAEIENTDLTILLAHKPQFFEEYSDNDVDLVLSGHAHGGQIRLPFIGGVFAPEQGFFPKYTAGKYQIQDTTMIVSRGLGNSVLPFRLFNRPDIVVITLEGQ